VTPGERFAAKARDWIGVPYVHRGTTRQGCDCTGLIIGCLQEMGYLAGYKLRYYPHDWNLHAMADDFIQHELSGVADLIPNNKVKRGDILIFRFGKCPAHSAVLTSFPTFIHSIEAGRRVDVGSLRSSKWGRRWIATWRLSEAKLGAHA